jgi:hypothetical protein
MNLSEQIEEAEARTLQYRRASRAHYLVIKRRLKRHLTSTVTLGVIAGAALGVGALSGIARRGRRKAVSAKPLQGSQGPGAGVALMRLATQIAPPLLSAWLLKKRTEAREREAQAATSERVQIAAADPTGSVRSVDDQ